MIFEEKTIKLNNGQEAILKSPAVEDAEELLNMVKTACGETDFLVRYPEEWDINVEQERAWIERLNLSESSVAIACYIGGRIAGNCQIDLGIRIKTRHSARVGISILKEYWNLGIGSAMFCELTEIAKSRGIKIIELGVIDGNERAMALYKKNGFCEVCRRPNAFMLKNGEMQTEIYMQKKL